MYLSVVPVKDHSVVRLVATSVVVVQLLVSECVLAVMTFHSSVVGVAHVSDVVMLPGPNEGCGLSVPFVDSRNGVAVFACHEGTSPIPLALLWASGQTNEEASPLVAGPGCGGAIMVGFDRAIFLLE